MSGPTTPDPAYNDPGWLAVVAFRYPDIHLVPGMYLFLPGSEG
nr:hypothetical protein [Pseudomonas otitidis]